MGRNDNTIRCAVSCTLACIIVNMNEVQQYTRSTWMRSVWYLLVLSVVWVVQCGRWARRAHIKLTVLFSLSLFHFYLLLCLPWRPCYRLSVCDTKWRSDECGSNRATVYSSLSSLWNAWIYYYLPTPWIEWNEPFLSRRFKCLISQVDEHHSCDPFLVISHAHARILAPCWLRVRWTLLFTVCHGIWWMSHDIKKAQRKQRKSTLHDDSHTQMKSHKMDKDKSLLQPNPSPREPTFVQRAYL